jgi:hypothetical protein
MDHNEKGMVGEGSKEVGDYYDDPPGLVFDYHGESALG